MASRAFLIVFLVVATALAPTLATDYTVGDGDGWKLGVDYTKWAAGKDFRVGDTLTFNYPTNAHNVLKVNGSDFQQCASSNSIAVTSTNGNDVTKVIPLATSGNKWYICGIADHCSKGMKLVITVSAEGPAPAPTPGTSAAGELSPLRSSALLLAVMAAYKMVLA